MVEEPVYPETIITSNTGLIHVDRRETINMGVPLEVPQAIRKKVSIGDYSFTWDSFQKLIQYIQQGVYPRWKDEVRPDYVLEMKKPSRRATSRYSKPYCSMLNPAQEMHR
jgi:hypothetical protein